MTFFTIKNIGLLLLLGVLVFPVGINQSYAQTPARVDVTEPANKAPITPDIVIEAQRSGSGTIDFGDEVTDDSDDFTNLAEIRLSLVNNGEDGASINPAASISTEVVFDPDDFESIGGGGTSLLGIGETLEFTVNAEAALGLYILEYRVEDSEGLMSTGNVRLTIEDIPNTAPTADHINIQIVPGTSATISFGDAIRDAESLFAGLDIAFSFVETDLTVNQISVTSGADVVDGSEGGATFLVTAEDVVITEQDGSGILDVPRTVELTYTVSDGKAPVTRGTVDILVVESLTSTFDGRLGTRTFEVSFDSLPTFTETFDLADYRDLINFSTTFSSLQESQLLSVMLSIGDGSHGGTATFTNNEATTPQLSNLITTLTYTPAEEHSGAEMFNYTGTGGDVIASGILRFNVGSPPNTVPTTPAITVTAIQGATGEIPFSSITDNEDMAFAEYTSVILDLTPASGVTNPAPNLSTQVVFNSADVDSSNTDDSRLLVTSETLGFTVNDEATAGEYTLVYTVTDSGDLESTGTLTFTIEAVTCSTSLSGSFNFGELAVGATSSTSSISILNAGNVPVQSLIQGANWVSADGTDIMDVGQTRYSVTEADGYDARTPFTAIPVDVGDDIAESESLDVFVQLLVQLTEQSFRGATTQTMTVTSDCSETP